MKRKHFLEGKIFSNVYVVSYDKGKYNCKCTCGKEFVARCQDLMNLCYKSCGCKKINKNEYTKESKVRFFKYVEKSDYCWNWIGGLSTLGYSRFVFNGKIWVGSRLIWTWTFGEIPEKMKICHKCDNRKCVNPDHLFLGTQKDNIQDMLNKGRWLFRRGNLKKPGMTVDQVEKIRKDIDQGMSRSDICEKYFIKSKATVSNIKNRKSWKHLLP